ncbi:MAG TPA: ATP-binding protein [Steroidobacteraceae bacterium]|nr:ATP-binding protein [Steroidobacteraceae bacterium]
MKRARTGFDFSQLLPVVVATSFAAVLTLLLTLGIQRASQLQSASAALQLASELRSLPQYFGTELTLAQRGLEARTFVGEPLADIATAQDGFDKALVRIDADLEAAGLGGSTDIQRIRGALDAAWLRFVPLLSAVGGHQGSPYSDTLAGSRLNATGRALKADVDEALAAHAVATRDVGGALKDLAAGLQDSVGDRGRSLRTFLVIGAGVAGLLLALMLYFSLRSRRASADARRAERQVADILGTVREGLFLLDRNLALGAVHSASLTRILHTAIVRDSSFEDLLRPLVPAKTLATAMKFVNLLWKEKVHEDLIDTVNPLSQIEVQFTRTGGGTESRHLSFAFRRVKSAAGQGEHLLGIVTDVTDRVQISHELEQAKAENQAQLDLVLQLLRVPAAQLQSFVRDSDMALRKSNAVLKQPGREESELRAKLHGVFREVHTVKGEASALALTSIAARVHQLEGSLVALRERASIDGNDFIPIVVKLDELMSYLSGVGQFADRLSEVQPKGDTLKSLVPPLLANQVLTTEEHSLEQLLTQVVRETAAAHSKRAAVSCHGLELIPAPWRRAAKEIVIHMARNAVVHGIETPEKRLAASKTDTAAIRVSFEGTGTDGFVLTVEDDGQGLPYERILDTALRKGLVSPADAARMERPAVYGLIFRPGFSTATEVTEHAGRGVGLDAVSQAVRGLGGSIGIATADGKFTRFRMRLPAPGNKAAATHAA